MTDKIKQIQEFIFDEDVQNRLVEINNNLMEFNILEITGMGNQEIKHSNIMGWLFGDNEHKLGYQILESFLQKVAERNKEKNLLEYIYLANKEKNIKVYREKDNIDLLLVDEANFVIVTIENKVFSYESGDQLSRYKENINKQYPDGKYTKYFVFLTIDLEQPSDDGWLIANHEMIVEAIRIILTLKKDMTTKTRIILESYIDLLKRNNVVEDKKLEELCKKIWEKSEYKNALNILFNYKPDRQKDIAEYLKNKIEENDKIELFASQKRYTSFGDKRWNNKVVYYQFVNTDVLLLTMIIGPSENKEFREAVAKVENVKKLSEKYCQIHKFHILTKEQIMNLDFVEIKKIIDSKLKEFFDEHFDKFYMKYKELLTQ